MNSYELGFELKRLNAEKRFSDALKLFDEQKLTLTNSQISYSVYIVYNVILALFQTAKSRSIIDFIKTYQIDLGSGRFGLFLKILKNKQNVDWQLLNRFCDLTTPESLSTECKTVKIKRKGEELDKELASDRENWYAAKSKSLFELGMYDECIKVSSTALEVLDKFHYSNKIWFNFRIALSKKQLGDIDGALKILLKIVKKKPEWFIQKEIAELFKNKNDYQNAIIYSIQAMNNFGDIEYKVGLIEILGDILEHKNEPILAAKHFMLSKMIKLKKGWRVSSSLEDSIKRVCQNLDFPKDVNYLIKDLKKYWKSFQMPIKNRSFGVRL